MNPLLKTNNLKIGFQKDHPLIESIQLEILEGEFIVLQGSNGSGKTTLMKTLCGLHPPLDGECKKFPHCRLSLVPQAKNLALEFPITVKDALFLMKKSWLRPSKMNSEERYILESTRVVEFWNLLLRECSGGQLQRFLIARSFLSGANLIFLDEPLDALDSEGQKSIFHLFKERLEKRNISIFLITHHLEEEWKTWFHKSYIVYSNQLVHQPLIRNS